MTEREAKNRIAKLILEINHHRYLYHVLDTEEISDGALDSLKRDLYLSIILIFLNCIIIIVMLILSGMMVY